MLLLIPTVPALAFSRFIRKGQSNNDNEQLRNALQRLLFLCIVAIAALLIACANYHTVEYNFPYEWAATAEEPNIAHLYGFNGINNFLGTILLRKKAKRDVRISFYSHIARRANWSRNRCRRRPRLSGKHLASQ